MTIRIEGHLLNDWNFNRDLDWNTNRVSYDNVTWCANRYVTCVARIPTAVAVVMIAVRVPPKVCVAVIVMMVVKVIPLAKAWVDLLREVVKAVVLANLVCNAVEADVFVAVILRDVADLVTDVLVNNAGVLDSVVDWVALLNLVLEVSSDAGVARWIDSVLNSLIEVVAVRVELADVFADVRADVRLALSGLELVAAHHVAHVTSEARLSGLTAAVATAEATEAAETWLAGESWDGHGTEDGERKCEFCEGLEHGRVSYENCGNLTFLVVFLGHFRRVIALATMVRRDRAETVTGDREKRENRVFSLNLHRFGRLDKMTIRDPALFYSENE